MLSNTELDYVVGMEVDLLESGVIVLEYIDIDFGVDYYLKSDTTKSISTMPYLYFIKLVEKINSRIDTQISSKLKAYNLKLERDILRKELINGIELNGELGFSLVKQGDYFFDDGVEYFISSANYFVDDLEIISVTPILNPRKSLNYNIETYTQKMDKSNFIKLSKKISGK